MKKAGIIGYGRFGRILAELLSKKYEVKVYDIEKVANVESIKICSLDDVLECILVFIAVPISSFENVVKKISTYKLYNTTIIDVCSVKVYPVDIMQKYLPDHVGIIATHPHFGPDSYSPFRELKTTICSIRDIYKRTNDVKEIFESQSIRTIEMTPNEHDRMAASSQGVTHFIGRVLNEAGVQSTNMNTMGFNELLGVIEQTCNDSWDLFKDLQHYNPYTNEMIDNIVATMKKIHKQIIEDAH